MPTYTFRCANCDHVFDLVQKFEEPYPTICPHCGHTNELQRVYKPVGVVFKGSGFYATDNKSASGLSANGSKPSSNGSEAESGSKSEPKESGKKEKETSSSSSPDSKD